MKLRAYYGVWAFPLFVCTAVWRVPMSYTVILCSDHCYAFFFFFIVTASNVSVVYSTALSSQMQHSFTKLFPHFTGSVPVNTLVTFYINLIRAPQFLKAKICHVKLLFVKQICAAVTFTVSKGRLCPAMASFWAAAAAGACWLLTKSPLVGDEELKALRVEEIRF